uniref:Uncharacterized protein n=1 Tax=Zea mays TaxID=4577 RepID=A0A804PC90_MAIZE
MDAEDMEDVQAPTAVQVLVSILLKQAVNSVNQKYFKMCPRKQKRHVKATYEMGLTDICRNLKGYELQFWPFFGYGEKILVVFSYVFLKNGPSYNEPPLQAKEQYCSYPYKALNNYSMYARAETTLLSAILLWKQFITVRPRVAIIMGSQTDLPVMKVVERVSKEFNIPSNYYFCTLNHIADDVEILRRV